MCDLRGVGWHFKPSRGLPPTAFHVLSLRDKRGSASNPICRVAISRTKEPLSLLNRQAGCLSYP